MAKLSHIVSRINGETTKEKALIDQLLVTTRRALDRESDEVSNDDLRDLLIAVSRQLASYASGLNDAISGVNVVEAVGRVEKLSKSLNDSLEAAKTALNGASESRARGLVKSITQATDDLKTVIAGIHIPETDLSVIVEALDALLKREAPTFDESRILAAIEAERSEEWEFDIERDQSSREIQSVIARRVS